MAPGTLAAGPSRLARKWYEVVVRPAAFFDRANEEERGQRAGLWFFSAVLLVGRLPDVAAPDDPLRSLALLAVLLLLSPAVLHVVTGFQYLLVWLVTDEDRGVDRTLRAVAYGSATGVAAAIPAGGAAAFLGWHLVAVGLASGHGLSRPRAYAAALPPSLVVFGVVFGGFGDAAAVWGAAGRLALG